MRMPPLPWFSPIRLLAGTGLCFVLSSAHAEVAPQFSDPAETSAPLDAPVAPPRPLATEPAPAPAAEPVVTFEPVPPPKVETVERREFPPREPAPTAGPLTETAAEIVTLPPVVRAPVEPKPVAKLPPPVDRTKTLEPQKRTAIKETKPLKPASKTVPAAPEFSREREIAKISTARPEKLGAAVTPQKPVSPPPQPGPSAMSSTVRAPMAETVPLKPAPASTVAPAASATRSGTAFERLTPNGKEVVLTGTLDRSTELGPEHSPVVIEGNFIVPPGLSLRLRAGTLVYLRADPKATPAAQIGSPDPTKSAVLWVMGSLLIEGITGNPVELINQDKDDASLLFYGAEQSVLNGARLKGAGVAQSGGVCQWTNCEFVNVKHYALAAGAGTFTQCSFRNCGGIFATYGVAPWALLARRNLFDGCREGIVLGGDPGEGCLVIEKNHFVRTRGAHLRAVPPTDTAGQRAASGAPRKDGQTEILIGENWYGSSMAEEIDNRIVDSRIDRALKARLNLRPPAEQPFVNTGAGVTAAVLAATARDQAATLSTLLQNYHGKVRRAPISDRPETASVGTEGAGGGRN